MGKLDILKGKVAQAIIEELFSTENLDYTVFPSGMERTFPGFGSPVRKKYNSKTAKIIQYLPDFICLKKNDEEEPLFIEVKYRGNNRFIFKEEYPDGYPYPDTFFILVSPKTISAQKASELAKGAKWERLSDIEELGVSKAIAYKYVGYCMELLGDKRKNPLANPSPKAEESLPKK